MPEHDVLSVRLSSFGEPYLVIERSTEPVAIDAIVAAFSDDSPLTKGESIITDEEGARTFIASLRIKRLTDRSWHDGHYALDIEYDSMLMGARVTFLSRDLRR